MQRFKKVLLVLAPVADNQAALDRAVTLAKENDAKLTVVKMVGPRPREAREFAKVMSVSDVHEMVIQAAHEQLAELLAPVRMARTRVDTKVLSGTAFLEIIREVLREQHDLVIMTAEHEGGLRAPFFCNTSLHLMRKCPCPVWVVKPTPGKRFARILAAVDTDPHDSAVEHDALNTKIMGLATSLATLEQSELHIVHAWTLYGESLFRSAQAHLNEAKVDALVREERQRHERQLGKLLDNSELGTVISRVHLVKGDADYVLPNLAQEQQIDLIVLGTVCRTGVAGFFIGNTAESVLRNVTCSVLTVKPDGFVSPISLTVN